MTCKLYESIEENLPNMVFVHYKQVGKLMEVLAKHHCPHMLGQNYAKNMASNKQSNVLVRTKQNITVPVEEWLDGKGNLLEWALGLTRAGYCQAKTRKMEDRLFACKDEILKVTG